MISYILKRVSKYTGTSSLVSTLAITLGFMAYFNLYCEPRVHHVPLDQELGGYNVTKVENTLAAFGEDGRKAYYTLITPMDMIFCWIYPFYFSAQLIRLYGWQRRSSLSDIVVKIITFSPFIAGVADFLENIYTFAAAYFYPLPKSYDWLVPICSTLTITKWAVIISSILLIILGGVKSLFFGSNNKPKSH